MKILTNTPENLNKTSERAELIYVTAPSEKQLADIKNFLKKKTGASNIELNVREDKSLGGGFILKCGSREYDWSTAGRIKQFEDQIKKGVREAQFSSKDIIEILRTEVEEFSLRADSSEVGVVTKVGDGIATIVGLDHAVYGEIIIFDNGVKGMVMDIREDALSAILFGLDSGIRSGSHAVRTGERAGIPVGDGYLGRVVDALGAPIDGAGPISSDETRPIENPAPMFPWRQVFLQ